MLRKFLSISLELKKCKFFIKVFLYEFHIKKIYMFVYTWRRVENVVILVSRLQ